MSLIAIDPGHGGQDRGASFGRVAEADIVLHVALYLEKLLIRRGFKTLLTRPINIQTSLSERVTFANAKAADIFVSLHCNADPDPDEPGDLEAKGEEIWIYNSSPMSRALAESLAVHVDKVFPGHRFRGIKESSSFYVLRKTTMPAALIELGFIDNTSELAVLADPGAYGKIAGLIADGIEQYLTRIE